MYGANLLKLRALDELPALLVILKTRSSEEVVKSLLPNLELTLAAHATDAVPQGGGNAASASGKYDLSSKTFSATEHVEIIPRDSETCVIWKPTLHLSRPRVRLQRPAIYFTVNLTMQAEALGKDSRKTDYLKSFEPLPANVLEPLRHDPALRHKKVFMPESMIVKVGPQSSVSMDVVKPIRGTSKRASPAVPALFTRIRCSYLPHAVIASLHLETSHVVFGTLSIRDVAYEANNTQIENLTKIQWPIETHSGDELVLLYKMVTGGNESLLGHRNQTPVSITISATVLTEQDLNVDLQIGWHTQLDLTHTKPNSTYKWSRPLSTTSLHQKRLSEQLSAKPPNKRESHQQMEAESESSVTFKLTGPDTALVDEEFKIEVQCNNDSTRVRRFALVMVQTRKPPRPESQWQPTQLDADPMARIFNPPVVDTSKPPDVLDLDPDVRIGPLPPGACFETYMRFRALTAGMLDFGVLRIVDLDTRRTVDVKELPEVIALSFDEAKN